MTGTHTSPWMRRAAAAVLAVTAVAGGAACGDDGTNAAAAKKIEALGAEVMPAEMYGLRVTTEDTAVVKNTEDPFVEAVGLYGLRDGELLQATLQVSRFTPKADLKSGRFRNQIVQQIGSSEPKPFRMGENTVYLTTGLRQSIAVWFRGRTMMVLSSRQDYDEPRALLRAALEQVKP